MIAGNHDITLHKDLYLETLKNKHRNIPDDVDAIRELWTGKEARRAGIVYLEEGVKTFTLGNGARFTVRQISFLKKKCMKCDFVTGSEDDSCSLAQYLLKSFPYSGQQQGEDKTPSYSTRSCLVSRLCLTIIC